MKKLLYSVLPFLAILLLFSIFGTSALADSCTTSTNCNGTLTQTVQAGTFSEVVTFTSPAPVTLATTDQATPEKVDAIITDENGDGTGFTLQITASQFVSPHDSLLPMSFKADGTVTPVGTGTYSPPLNPSMPTASIANSGSGANNTFTYFVSPFGSGEGEWDIPATGQVTVKSNNLAETYTSTQTVLLIDGAGF